MAMIGDRQIIEEVESSISKRSGDNFHAHLLLLRELTFKRNLSESAFKIRQEIDSNPSATAQEIIDLSQGMINSCINRVMQGESETHSYQSLEKSFLLKLKERALSTSTTTGQSTGISDLDSLTLGLQDTDLVVLAARPSMGKTTLAMNMIEQACLEGKRSLVFSLEMPASQLIERSVASIGSIDATNLRTGRLNSKEQGSLEYALNKVRNWDIVIDDRSGLTVDQLIAKSKQVHREKPVDIMMIDYLQLLKIPQGSSRTEGITDISAAIKGLAKELGVPIILLSQLNRSLENRENKRPINSDLRDSGAIEQDADVILFIYRDEVYNELSEDKGVAEIIIGKQRNGPLGTARAEFLGKYSKFRNLSLAESITDDAVRVNVEQYSYPLDQSSVASNMDSQGTKSSDYQFTQVPVGDLPI
jgi:replicative DNA helicase